MKPLFPLESTVYLCVNAERKGMVTGHLARPGGVMLYLVTWDDPIEEKEHWACELSATKPEPSDWPGGEKEGV